MTGRSCIASSAGPSEFCRLARLLAPLPRARPCWRHYSPVERDEGQGMTTVDEHSFDRTYWERHWHAATGRHQPPPHPYLAAETAHLAPGRALDAGCGTGAEAVWLAEQGWQVTGTDISGTALTAARARGRRAGVAGRVGWGATDRRRRAPPRSRAPVRTSR